MSCRSATLILLAVLVFSAACERPPRRRSVSEARMTALRERVLEHFDRGFYLKPAAGEADTRSRTLAPLFILDTPDTNAPPDLPEGKIFFLPGQTLVHGRPHEQMTYLWAYPKSANRRPDALPAQGIRITFDSAGQPVLWESLADTSGARIFFVSQSLEARAAREFGGPATGRVYAIERPVADAPAVVVARLIEDAPVEMGPIIYLRAGTRDVSTMICRCMAAQARELAGMAEYELAVLPDRPPPVLRALLAQTDDSPLTSLTNLLRLPRDF